MKEKSAYPGLIILINFFLLMSLTMLNAKGMLYGYEDSRCKGAIEEGNASASNIFIGWANLNGNLPFKIALIFSQELRNYREVLYFPVSTYPEFKVGQQVCELIRETICSHYPEARDIEEHSSMEGFDFIMKFSLNRQNSGKHSVAPLSSYASPEMNKQQGRVHLIRYTVSLSVELIDGKNMKTMKKENLEESATYVRREEPLSEQPTAKGIEFETGKFIKTIDKVTDGLSKKTLNFLKTTLNLKKDRVM